MRQAELADQPVCPDGQAITEGDGCNAYRAADRYLLRPSRVGHRCAQNTYSVLLVVPFPGQGWSASRSSAPAASARASPLSSPAALIRTENLTISPASSRKDNAIRRGRWSVKNTWFPERRPLRIICNSNTIILTMALRRPRSASGYPAMGSMLATTQMGQVPQPRRAPRTIPTSIKTPCSGRSSASDSSEVNVWTAQRQQYPSQKAAR
jgi:hypothetical protein